MARLISFMALVFCAAVLAISSAPVNAQVVKLYCKNEHPANNFLIEIDFGAGQVTWGNPNLVGAIRLGPTSARITDYEIVWNGIGSARGILYRIDRINATQTACDRDGCWPESVCQKTDEVRRQF